MIGNPQTGKNKIKDIQFNQADYNHSMLLALNHYNIEVDSNTKQDWVLEYFKNNNMDTNRLGKLPSSLFDQLGVLIRLKEIGVALIDTHEKYIKSKHYQLMTLAHNEMPEKHQNHYKKLIKEPVVENSLSEHLEKFLITLEDYFDRILLNSIKLPDISKLFKEQKFNNNDYQLIKCECKLINEKYSTLLSQYDSSEEVKESYQHIKKTGLQRGINFLDLIIKECDSVVVKKKIIRQKKNKPAKDIVKKLNFLESASFQSLTNKSFNVFPSLTIKSFEPKNIIGCKELIIFNTKTRKIFIYKSEDETGLSVKGSTLLNFSEENSFCKTIRKPELFFKDFSESGKREINNKIKNIKSVVGKTTGRINKDCLLLKYY